MLSMTEPPILLLALRAEEQRGQYALHAIDLGSERLRRAFPRSRARGGGCADPPL